MNILREKEDQFFSDWKAEVEVNGKIFFVQDGAINAENYVQSKPKILSLMKETPIDGTASTGYNFGDGVNQQLTNHGRFKFQNARDVIRIITGRISCIMEILIKGNLDFSYEEIQGENIQSKKNIEYFKESAYVNIKKYNGLPLSNQKDLENVIGKDREKLKIQINGLLQPDIILSGMKIHYYKVINNGENPINLLVSGEKGMVNIFEENLGTRKRIIIETYHPSYRKYSERVIFEDLKNALIDLRNKKIDFGF